MVEYQKKKEKKIPFLIMTGLDSLSRYVAALSHTMILWYRASQ